jgi:hypothetical protein
MPKRLICVPLSFALFVATLPVAVSSQPSPAPIIAPKPTLDAAESAILQGDGLSARAALSAINIGRLSPKDQLTHNCMLERLKPQFVAGPMPGLGDPIAGNLLTAFRL